MPDDDRPVTHRFCPNCGTEAVAGASFCAACGHSLSTVAQTVRPGPRDIRDITVPRQSDSLPMSSYRLDPAGTQGTRSMRSVQPKITTSSRPTQIVKENKGGKLIWVVLIALVVVGAGGAGVFFASHHGSAPQASFGLPCSQNPACSGASAATSPQTTAPSSAQLQAAYQRGYSWGQQLVDPNGRLSSQYPSEFQMQSSCRTGQYPSVQLNTQFFDGCMAGGGY
jgi:hypothetical protein